jgi:hypothetical protein
MTVIYWAAVIIILIASVGLLLVRNWRISIAMLAAQYIGMFILLLAHLPIGMASVKVIVGWMSCAILGMTRADLGEDLEDRDIWPRGRLFRLSAAGMVAILIAGAVPAVNDIMADAGTPVTSGALLLIGMGLLHLGITSQILRVTQGLMTVLAGFEILYSSVEGSVLIAALLAIIILGLSLTGSYLMTASSSQKQRIT